MNNNLFFQELIRTYFSCKSLRNTAASSVILQLIMHRLEEEQENDESFNFI